MKIQNECQAPVISSIILKGSRQKCNYYRNRSQTYGTKKGQCSICSKAITHMKNNPFIAYIYLDVKVDDGDQYEIVSLWSLFQVNRAVWPVQNKCAASLLAWPPPKMMKLLELKEMDFPFLTLLFWTYTYLGCRLFSDTHGINMQPSYKKWVTLFEKALGSFKTKRISLNPRILIKQSPGAEYRSCTQKFMWQEVVVIPTDKWTRCSWKLWLIPYLMLLY